VYVDTDFECLRPIDPLIEGIEFCTAAIKPGRVSNTLIGATPRHPILERAVREVRPRTEYGLDKSGTGPLFFNKLIREYPEVTIFPPEYFYPATPGQRERAYAIHHFARSWQDPEDLRRALLKAELKLAEASERIEELERHPLQRLWRLPRSRP
jgi:mannosyltransferase OCH1-like enzyme